MAEDKVKLIVEVDAKDAQATLELFGKESAKVVQETERGFSKLKSGLSSTFKEFGAQAVAAAAAFASYQTVVRAVGEAVEAEKAVTQLSLAIASTGEYSKEAIVGLTDFSNELSALTGIDDDVINGQLALAKSFGISNDQAKSMVKAASNLAAVTGQDLESAVRQLGGTYDGTLGKIANLGPAFRNLTKEQIEAGAAIDLINKKFAGAGEALGTTFEGSLNKLTNSVNDAFKEIGKVIINNPTLINALKKTAELFQDLAPIVASITTYVIKAFEIMASGILQSLYLITAPIASLADAVGLDSIRDSFDNFSTKLVTGLDSISRSVNDLEPPLNNLDSTFKKVSDSAGGIGDKTSASAKAAKEAFDKMKQEAEKFADALAINSGTEIERVQEQYARQFQLLEEYHSKGLLSADKYERSRSLLVRGYEEKLTKIVKDSTRDQDEIRRKALEDEEKRRDSALQSSASSAVSGATSSGDKRGAIGNILSGALSAFLGPLGAVLGQFVSALGTMSKENAKQFVKEFLESAPEFARTFGENLPEFFAGAVETAFSARFWSKAAEALGMGLVRFMGISIYALDSVLKGRLTEFAQSFGARLQSWIQEVPGKIAAGFSSFFSGIGQAAKSFGMSIANEFKTAVSSLGFKIDPSNIVSGIRNALQTAFSSFTSAFSRITSVFDKLREGMDQLRRAFQPLVDALNVVKEALNKVGGAFGGGGGGGGGLLNRAKSALGFSKGGTVPKYAADGMFVPRGTDTVPAMLTPGELVVPRDMVGELSSFLSKQKGETVSQDTAILTAILQALQAPTTVNSEVKINQSVFAEIMLQLNRQNARVSA